MNTKTITALLATTIVLAVFLIGLPSRKPEMPVELPVATPSPIESPQPNPQSRRQEIAAQDSLDSIRLADVLIEARKIAGEHAAEGDFEVSYTVGHAEEGEIIVEINSAHLFSSQFRHLIIRRSGLGEMNIDIFVLHNEKYVPVLAHSQPSVIYINDTLQDVNGDGRKDFVSNGYGATGCCLKAFRDVYLLRPDGRSFSKGFWFINPTFAPRERVVRGVCYGHIGETEMYKFRWKGESLDTLAYIAFEKDSLGEKTGKFVESKQQHGSPHRILLTMPAEYTFIEGYDWFLGNFGGE
jgi:hypothetical protein